MGINQIINLMESAKQADADVATKLYAKALESLVHIQKSIRSHDQSLNDREVAPNGDDYNDILSVLGL